MAFSELETMERSELEDRLADSRKELFNLRFQMATGQLDNTARVGHVRKEVARILTFLRQEDLAAEDADDLVGSPVGVPPRAGADSAQAARARSARARSTHVEDSLSLEEPVALDADEESVDEQAVDEVSVDETDAPAAGRDEDVDAASPEGDERDEEA